VYNVNMNERWKKSNTCVCNIGYHLIWCPKYRRSVLIDGVDIRLAALLKEKAADMNVTIVTMEIMPDHVHLFVKAEPTNPVHFIIGNFKGYSSRILRKEFPWLKSRLPSLWTRSYYAETVGHISENVVKKYIEEQKKN